MKKKILTIGLTSLIAGISIALSVLIGKASFSPKQARGVDEYYTITILPENLDTVLPYQSGSESPCHDGSPTVQTDQNHNDVALAFEHAYVDAFNDTPYMRFYGTSSMIYNTQAMNSICKIEVFADSSLDLYWGWKEAGVVNYAGYRQGIAPGLSGNEYNLNGDKPNYFKLQRNSSGQCSIKKIVVYLDKTCTPSENPYVFDSGIKYRKYGLSAMQAAGFEGAPIANLVIKSEVNGLPVTKIGQSAFRSHPEITSLTLPQTIQEVGEYAFYQSPNIASIIIPKSVTSIGYLSFGDIYNCESLTFESGGTSLLTIAQASFRSIGHVGVLTLPSRVESIGGGGGGTFTGATHITAYGLNSDNVQGNAISVDASGVLFYSNYGKELFSYPAASPETSYTVPSDVVKLHSSESFRGALNLEEITFTNTSGLMLYDYSLSSMPQLSKVNFNGSGAVTFCWYCLSGCPNLTSLVVPDNSISYTCGLGELGTSTKHAKVYFEGSALPVGFNNVSWDSSDVEHGYTSFYFYSENDPGTSEGRLSSWRYVEGNPRVWGVSVDFKCYKTNIDSGWAFYVLGSFNNWTANEASRGTFDTDHWTVTVVLVTYVQCEFKACVSTWDEPTELHWEYEGGENRTFTPDDAASEYVIPAW